MGAQADCVTETPENRPGDRIIRILMNRFQYADWQDTSVSALEKVYGKGVYYYMSYDVYKMVPQLPTLTRCLEKSCPSSGLSSNWIPMCDAEVWMP